MIDAVRTKVLWKIVREIIKSIIAYYLKYTDLITTAYVVSDDRYYTKNRRAILTLNEVWTYVNPSSYLYTSYHMWLLI